MWQLKHLLSESFQGIRASSPVALAYLGIGLATGVVGAEAGLSVAEVSLLSLLVFAGSAQFIFAELYTGSEFALIGTIFLINLRHLLYSIALTPYVRNFPLYARLWIGTQLTDETFVLGSSLMGTRLQTATSMIALNTAAYLAWTIGNVGGAILGQTLSYLGLEFALASMFAALLIIQLKTPRRTVYTRVSVAITAVIVMIGLDTWYPHPLNLVATTLTAATLGLILERLLMEKKRR
ncbi:MAG: AzlC family ABC transporter permease [Halothece sp.]